jgi:hypothetical protein
MVASVTHCRPLVCIAVNLEAPKKTGFAMFLSYQIGLRLFVFVATLSFSGFAAAGGHKGEHVGGHDTGLSKEQKIKVAAAAAPSNISDEALILDSDNTVLREGSNDWICMVGTPPSYENPMCVDAPWQRWLDAFVNQKPYKNEENAIGISYMLIGDIPVDNDNPMNLDESKGTWVQEGPHLMVLVPPELFGDLPRTPYEGGAYVMWEGSEFAHIMIPLEKTTPITYAD